MSFDRIRHPSEILSINQEIEMKIIRIEGTKIYLGLKQLAPDPWFGIKEKYPVNSKHTGVITAVKDFGGLVMLDKNIQGLLHKSKMKGRKPTEILNVGQSIDVYILRIKEDEKKIGLGLELTAVIINGKRIYKNNYYVGRFKSETDKFFEIYLFEDVIGLLEKNDKTKQSIENMNLLPEGHRIIKVRVANIENENNILLTLDR